MFTHEKITGIEVDIIDACGLRCPVCSRNSKITFENLKGLPKFLTLQENIEIFERFKNLECVSFVGTRSESSLYPHLIEFISYLKSRNIRIIISTNGNSKDCLWWSELGNNLTTDDEVRFAIDGSTQEIYSQYRVGGCLLKVLEHHKALKQTSNCITVLQFIQFKYNQSDINNIKKLREDHCFDTLLLGHGSYTLDGRESADKDEFINSNFKASDYHPPEEIYKKYKLIESTFVKYNNTKIECTSYENNELFINHLGQYNICCFHNGEMLRTGNRGGDMEFINTELNDKVYPGKYKFCLTNCNKICKSLIPDLIED